jgi:preprotein translocase subunit SecY
MASPAEQLASSINFGALAKATELKKRLLFTLGALIIYRLGTYLPLPGIDPVRLAEFFQGQSSGIVGLLDMFAGGAVSRMSIFALNIMPYISASIIMQLLTSVSPKLEALKKEGESGRKKINQYTRMGTVVLAAAQAFGVAQGLVNQGGLVTTAPLLFTVSTVVTLTAGTIFLMWLGEQITARGVGNGISLIIFSGIVAQLPSALAATFEQARTGELEVFWVVGLLVMAVGVITFIVFMERAQRRLTVQFPKRQVGMRVTSGEMSHLPLKINTAGVIPPIFASSLLLLPLTFVNFSGSGSGGGADWVQWLARNLGHGTPAYLVLYVAMIVFFAFFYTAVVFNPADTADNLKKNGGFIPGYRPGKTTAEYLDYVLTRLTVVGSAYLAFVCLLPELLIAWKGNISFYFGGTSLLIVVSVTMDTVAQIHSHLLAHQYEGLIKKAKLKGRRG